MKTTIFRLLTLGAFVLLTSLLAAPAQAQLGVLAGLNFDDLSDIEIEDREGTVDNATGYHIGLFYDLAAGPVGLRPSLIYRQINSIDYEGVDDALEGFASEFDVNLIEVALDARLRTTLPLVSPYVLAGPVVGFASSDNELFDENLNNLTLAANIGAGVDVSLPGMSLTLSPELRYSFGITGLVDEFDFLEDEGITITGQDEQKLNAFMLRLGVTF